MNKTESHISRSATDTFWPIRCLLLAALIAMSFVVWRLW